MYLFIIKLLLLLVSGVYIIYKDLKERIIPNWIVIVLLISGLVVTAIDYTNIISHVLGFLICGLILFFIAVITKAFGLGDVKYMFAVGLIIGIGPGINAIMFGFILGGIASLVLVITKKVKMKDYIAFGPYLVIGSLIALIYSIL